jgi:hypothetical protein
MSKKFESSTSRSRELTEEFFFFCLLLQEYTKFWIDMVGLFFKSSQNKKPSVLKQRVFPR